MVRNLIPENLGFTPVKCEDVTWSTANGDVDEDEGIVFAYMCPVCSSPHLMIRTENVTAVLTLDPDAATVLAGQLIDPQEVSQEDYPVPTHEGTESIQ
jgi:hypothetical protein